MASFLQSDNGNFSSARLMFVTGLAYDMVITALGLFTLGWTMGEGLAFFTGISGVFIGLKLGQKPMEERGDKKV